MGNDLRKGIVLDFFGLPGSGKTTIASMVANRLKEENYKVQDKIYVVNNKYGSIKRILIKLLNTLLFTTKNPVYILDLFSMLDKNTYVNKKELIKQWVNICFVLTNINKAHGKDIVIADQGIIQAAISLTYNNNNDTSVIIKKLNEKVPKKVFNIYISTELEKCLIRMDKRENGESRVDYEKDINKKRNYLISIETICKEIIKDYYCIKIENDYSFQQKNDGPVNKVYNLIFDN